MPNAQTGFDPIGVVVDWIDACRTRNLGALVGLYDDAATVDCCEGERFRGHSELEKYWRPKLERQVAGAFEIEALFPEPDRLYLDYRGYDGRSVRTYFRFTDDGKISLTACDPLQAAA